MSNSEQLLAIHISPSSGTPIYRQLMEQVHRLVASQRLKPGDELPSVRNLAEQLEINPMTVSKAYSGLELQGILIRQRGKTMTVAQTPQAKQSVAQRLQKIRPSVDSLLVEAKQLDLSKEQLLDFVEQCFKKNSDD